MILVLSQNNDLSTDIAQKTVRERLAVILVHLEDTFGFSKEPLKLLLYERNLPIWWEQQPNQLFDYFLNLNQTS